MEKKEGENANGVGLPRKKRRRDENNFNNFVGHEIIDGEDEDDGTRDAHLDELMDGLDEAQGCNSIELKSFGRLFRWFWVIFLLV